MSCGHSPSVLARLRCFVYTPTLQRSGRRKDPSLATPKPHPDELPHAPHTPKIGIQVIHRFIHSLFFFEYDLALVGLKKAFISRVFENANVRDIECEPLGHDTAKDANVRDIVDNS